MNHYDHYDSLTGIQETHYITNYNQGQNNQFQINTLHEPVDGELTQHNTSSIHLNQYYPSQSSGSPYLSVQQYNDKSKLANAESSENQLDEQDQGSQPLKADLEQYLSFPKNKDTANYLDEEFTGTNLGIDFSNNNVELNLSQSALAQTAETLLASFMTTVDSVNMEKEVETNNEVSEQVTTNCNGNADAERKSETIEKRSKPKTKYSDVSGDENNTGSDEHQIISKTPAKESAKEPHLKAMIKSSSKKKDQNDDSELAKIVAYKSNRSTEDSSSKHKKNRHSDHNKKLHNEKKKKETSKNSKEKEVKEVKEVKETNKSKDAKQDTAQEKTNPRTYSNSMKEKKKKFKENNILASTSQIVTRRKSQLTQQCSTEDSEKDSSEIQKPRPQTTSTTKAKTLTTISESDEDEEIQRPLKKQHLPLKKQKLKVSSTTSSDVELMDLCNSPSRRSSAGGNFVDTEVKAVIEENPLPIITSVQSLNEQPRRVVGLNPGLDDFGSLVVPSSPQAGKNRAEKVLNVPMECFTSDYGKSTPRPDDLLTMLPPITTTTSTQSSSNSHLTTSSSKKSTLIRRKSNVADVEDEKNHHVCQCSCGRKIGDLNDTVALNSILKAKNISFYIKNPNKMLILVIIFLTFSF